MIQNVGLTFQPITFSDQCAEVLSLIANLAKAVFWKAEQNLHYVFLKVRLGRLGQENHKVIEIAKRAVIILPALAATLMLTPLALLGHCLQGISNRLHSREFVYLEGLCQEVKTKTPKIMHLNACMFAGGLPYAFGGVRTAGERFDGGLLRLIKNEDPDICFLCEFSETLTPRLYEGLKKQYKHFFVNIGSNAWGMDASLSVISKVPLVKKPIFIPSAVESLGDQKMMYRGYFILETEDCSYLYTHLHAINSVESETIRKEQLREIKSIVEDSKATWIVLGDLNMDRGGEGHLRMKEHFVDEIENEHGAIPTFAVGLTEGTVKEESLDYLLTVIGKPVTIKTKIIDTYSSQEPLSDHKAIVGFCKF